MRPTFVCSLAVRAVALSGLLAAGTACSPDLSGNDPEGDDSRAQAIDSPLDAGAMRPASDAATGADAGASADGGADPCGAGKITCGSTCIDVIAPRAEVLQERVFGRSCGLSRSCHGGPSPQASLHLDSLDALSGVVGRPATEDPSLALIAAGRPEDSYLVRKLRNTHGKVGTVMPPGAPLCEPKVAAVEAWIRAGAAR